MFAAPGARPSYGRAPALLVALLLATGGVACTGDEGTALTTGSPSTGAPTGTARPPPLPRTPPGGPGAPNGPPGGAGGNRLSFGEVDLTRAPPADARPAPVDTPNGALCAGCDVVLITVCSLRRDHVGAFGSPLGLTPTLDRVAAGGMRFDAAYAASNFTLPSLTSLFTGQFPSTTGVLNWDRGIGADVPVLAEVLGYYGYATGAFTIDAPSGFRAEFGLDRGFQRMRVSTPPNGTPDGRHTAAASGQGPSAARNAAEWIAAQRSDKPIFVAYHDRNAHYPYVVSPVTEGPTGDDPTGVRKALWEEGLAAGGQGQLIGQDPVVSAVRSAGAAGAAEWRRTYAEAVARMDTGLGEVIAAVDARGRRDRTVLVVVADHGESLDDHGELLHGISYFEPVIHVPLLIDAPGVAPGSATRALASHVDLFPTLAELVGAAAPAGIDGVSLVPVLRGEAASVRLTTIVEGGVMLDRPESLRGALLSPPWSLLIQPPASVLSGGPPQPGTRPGQLETTLYDLARDPLQTTDVASANSALVTGLTARWEGFRAARAGRAVPTELTHDPAFIELLQRTGYDFRPTAPSPAPSSGPPSAPPKR